jgi:hypothetical protein
MQETKKAFRNIFKRGNIESAAQALCNLKGVGPTMASGTRIGTITVNTSNTLKEKKTQVGKVILLMPISMVIERTMVFVYFSCSLLI